MYALAQREAFGFDKAVETAKAAMARYGVTPNMIIVPPQVSLYMNIGSAERIKFDTYGQKGPSQFDSGVAGFEASTFRGCGVFTSSPFESGDDQDAVQMLQRSTQVGEFYKVRTPPKGTPRPDGFMDLVIFDEEMDKLVRIPGWKIAMMAIKYAKQGAASASPEAQVAYQQYLDADVSTEEKAKEYIDDLKDQNTEAEFVVARPFIEHLMMSAVLTVSGRDTGATLYGPADMQVSANTSVKTIEGHFTYAFCPLPFALCAPPSHAVFTITGATPNR